MIVAIDVDYREEEAIVAAVIFANWADAAPVAEQILSIKEVAPYEPGFFYRRELPCLLAILAQISEPIDVVVVDGYVWLPGGKKGLGAYLYEVLDDIPVVGVAKTSFAGSAQATAVYRGKSERPLFVTVAGMENEEAVDCVQQMDGAYRIPTLLKRVDQLCRAGK